MAIPAIGKFVAITAAAAKIASVTSEHVRIILRACIDGRNDGGRG